MKVVMIGVNHRTAPLDMRERLALTSDKIDRAVELRNRQQPVAELVALSTCNRTELYLAGPEDLAPDRAAAARMLCAICDVEFAQLRDVLDHMEDDAAIKHVFEVACGLDSMLIGEPQILGQVKRAYESAHARRTVGPVMHKVFQSAIAAAKMVRNRTGIDDGRISVGSVAVDFARQIFERFDDKTVLAIGAGDMAKLILRHLRDLMPEKMWITSRTHERARQLIESLGLPADSAGARPIEELDELLVEADIVLTGTGSPQPIITVDRFKPLLRRRRRRPLCMIDISLPRDVAPDVAGLTNVYLYNLDDLQAVVAKTHVHRSELVDQCHSLLAGAVATCVNEVQHRDIGQTIKALRQKLHQIGKVEQERTARKLAAAPPTEVRRLLEEHGHRIINKVLHMPLQALDRRRADQSLGYYAAALHHLFGLDDSSPNEAQADVEPQHHLPATSTQTVKAAKRET